jgi:predicted amidophosphoribosyltransferase
MLQEAHMQAYGEPLSASMEAQNMSSDAPVTMEVCDRCGKPIPEIEFIQCRDCGGYFHKACYYTHTHGMHVFHEPWLHEWRT